MRQKITMQKISIAALNTTINDWSGLLQQLRQILKKAHDDGTMLLVLPELAIGTPDAGDLYLRPQTALFAEQALAELAPMTKGLTLICGTPFRHDEKLYNVAAVFHDGMLKALVPKRYPDEHTDEERYFARWDFSSASKPHLGAMIGPFNEQIPGLENLQICVGNIANHPDITTGSLCVELNNSIFAVNRFRTELTNRIKWAEMNDITLVRTNMLGCLDGTHIYDGGGYIIDKGEIAALAPRFSYNEFTITSSGQPLPKAFDPSLAAFIPAHSCPLSEEDYNYAEIELALCLALHDYMKRAHTSKLCLALSGGRDSAMIAVIAARMLAIQFPDESEEQLKSRMKNLMLCAYLPNQNSSSSGTQKAALALAQKFGFDCPVIPINELAAQTVSTIENAIGRKLSWETDDLTLQNVQARTRSSIIWTMANAANALLLTTGNLSEAAVGYSTMDGDSSGSLDPIGGIPKTIVSSWLEWAAAFHHIPELELVFAQPPSAELRPIETKQADEKDLMPYPVLDAYIEWFIVKKLSPKEVLAKAKQKLTDYYNDDQDIRRDIKKFVTMAARSQWKRVRFANSFVIMPYDLAPESDLRWPCLQDAFTKALAEL